MAVTCGCAVAVSLLSCSLHAAYKRSLMTVHLVLSQSLFMSLKPLHRARHIKQSAEQIRPRSAVEHAADKDSKLLGKLSV